MVRLPGHTFYRALRDKSGWGPNPTGARERKIHTRVAKRQLTTFGDIILGRVIPCRPVERGSADGRSEAIGPRLGSCSGRIARSRHRDPIEAQGIASMMSPSSPVPLGRHLLDCRQGCDGTSLVELATIFLQRPDKGLETGRKP